MKGPHKKNDRINTRYEIIDFVGEGGMQYVYSAHDNILDRVVALKTPKNNSAEKRFKRSAEVAAQINHPNVAKTFDYFEVASRQYLIEEFIDGTDLDQSLKNLKYLDPYLAARVFHHISKGLAASHHAGVVHRDLKPTNVMVTGDIQVNAVKITDFGIAKMAHAELQEAVEGQGVESINNSQTAVGALPYMSPESIETPKRVGTPSDVWSIGAMVYELITGRKPYGSGLQAVSKIVQAAPPAFPAFLTANPQFAPLSSELIDIVMKCLKKDPNDRPTADQIADLCGKLYYPVVPRYIGTVTNIMYGAWGFINLKNEDVFFNLKSVYGDPVNIGDKVMISKFQGGGAWRCHPVVKII